MSNRQSPSRSSATVIRQNVVRQLHRNTNEKQMNITNEIRYTYDKLQETILDKKATDFEKINFGYGVLRALIEKSGAISAQHPQAVICSDNICDYCSDECDSLHKYKHKRCTQGYFFRGRKLRSA